TRNGGIHPTHQYLQYLLLLMPLQLLLFLWLKALGSPPSFGPAALCGQIALLVSIALSALVGQDITLKDTRSLHEVCKDLHIFCYYDDFLIFGLPELVDRFVSIIQYTATRIGATFPPEKQDVLTPTQWFRHLGVEWGLLPDGCLGIRCVPPPSPEPLEATLSKRHAFAIAGAFYDPLTLHADARLCADYIRSFAGKAPGNTPKDWDTKWPLTKTQQLNLRDIIGIASKAMQPHQAHSSLPSEITHVSIIINCDASSTGYGWTTSLSDASKETNSPILWETYAKAFKTNEANSWHVNRKEMYCLSQSLAQLREWLDLIPVDLTVKTIIVNTDNTSALTWSQQKPVKMRSFDSTAILRMINGLRESAAATIAQAKEEGWWWPTMAKDIEALIETCHCQVARRIRLKGQPLSRRRVKDRFATVQMDFIGPISGNPANPAIDNLPPGGWKYFLVIIDEGTHCSMTIPAQDTSAQSCIIGSLIWFGAYGPPDRIHSDSGNGLASSEFQKFLQAWNIEQEFGSPETPRHQGLVEQLNGALKQVMKSNNSNEYPIPWYLSILCANIARQSVPLRHALGLTPSELALGASHSALLRGADLLAEQRLKQDSVDTNAPKNKATDDSHNNEQLTVWGLTNVVTHNLYCLYTLLRNERLDSEDVQDLFNL
ncbi:hypothetical protein FOL47_002122, partial [Perkinsus chesapeaki]